MFRPSSLLGLPIRNAAGVTQTSFISTPEAREIATTSPGRGSQTYITEYVRNRLSTATVTDGGSNNITLTTNYYDGSNQNTTYNYGPRNLTTSTTLAGTTYLTYGSNGNVLSSTVNGVTTSATYDTSATNSVPTQLKDERQ